MQDLVDELRKENAALREENALLRQIIEELRARIIVLEAKLNKNSTNSSKPPSTDPPWKKPKTQTATGPNKKGAQPGHKGIARALLPVEEVDEVIVCEPVENCSCGGSIELDKANVERKQVFELPVIKPIVTEFQILTGCCIECACKYRGSLPVGTPAGILGPRAISTISYLTGRFHQSKRDIVEFFCDFFNIAISLGSVCNAEQQMSEALKTPHDELATAAQKEPVASMDETGHKIAGVLISDRYPGYTWMKGIRQLRWAHLIRDLVKYKESIGESSIWADRVLTHVKTMFVLWHGFKAGHITRQELQESMIATRKRQGLKVYEYLVQTMTAHLRGETVPTLIVHRLTA